MALRFACERCSACPLKKTASPGSSTAGCSRPAYLAATGVRPLRDSSGSSAPVIDGMSASSAVAAVAGLLVGVRVDGLVLAAGGDPEAAVLGVGAVERDPGADQRVGLGDDVERVLVVALAGAARALDEQHRLQREDVGPDQRGDDVEHARVQQVALVQLEPPVQHVDAQQVLQARLRGLVVRAERRRARDGDAAGDEVVDVVEQLPHLVARVQAADDQEPVLAEVDVLVDADRPGLLERLSMTRRYGWTGRAAMATMRVLLSEIDPVSVGDVVYPPGGRLGPRWQRDVELVLVHAGSARIAVDGDIRATLRAGSVGLLLPGHREHFAFAGDEPTRHSWVQGRLAYPRVDRLAALPAALPASTALTELVREAVAVARTPLSTAEPLLRALATAALWRYVGEAESRSRGPGDTVDRARALPARAPRRPARRPRAGRARRARQRAAPRAALPRGARRHADGLPLAAARRDRDRPARQHGTARRARSPPARASSRSTTSPAA